MSKTMSWICDSSTVASVAFSRDPPVAQGATKFISGYDQQEGLKRVKPSTIGWTKLVPWISLNPYQPSNSIETKQVSENGSVNLRRHSLRPLTATVASVRQGKHTWFHHRPKREISCSISAAKASSSTSRHNNALPRLKRGCGTCQDPTAKSLQ